MKDLFTKTRHLFRSRYPKMDERRMHSFVASCLMNREVFIRLKSELGSPLYVLDEKRLRSRVKRLREAFEKHLGSIDVFYAVKSNNLPDISRIMVDECVGLDVSSGMELALACKIGASQIFFSGPGKTEAELTSAIDHADRVTILMDSFGELRSLDRLTRQRRHMLRAGVRLTTNPNGLWRKFGIPLSSLAEFLRETHNTPFVKFEGLQFHTSWNLSPDAQTAFISELGAALSGLPANQQDTIKFLDIGGGFWPEQGEWLRAAGTPLGQLKKILFPNRTDVVSRFWLKSRPIEVFAHQIAVALQSALPKTLDCRVCLEPGRWLCHEAMHLLMTVVDVKSGNLAITDAGTNTIGWERFEHDYFPVINLTHPGVKEHPCNILGSLCTPHDVWGYSYYGTSICQGDLLLIPTQGAYTYSLRQNFIKPLPEVVISPQEVVLDWPEGE